MNIVEAVIEKIKSQFEGEATGHDWHHIMRVYNLSRFIQEKEGGDLEIIELAALLHDISDHKFNGGKLDEGGKIASSILDPRFSCTKRYVYNSVVATCSQRSLSSTRIPGSSAWAVSASMISNLII